MTEFEERVRTTLEQRATEAPAPAALLERVRRDVARARQANERPHRRALVLAAAAATLVVLVVPYAIATRGSHSTPQAGPTGPTASSPHPNPSRGGGPRPRCAEPPFQVRLGDRVVALREFPSHRPILVARVGDVLHVVPRQAGGCVALGPIRWTGTRAILGRPAWALHRGAVVLQGGSSARAPWALAAVQPGRASFDITAVIDCDSCRGPFISYGSFKVRVLPARPSGS
jgi:hypothetical protein